MRSLYSICGGIIFSPFNASRISGDCAARVSARLGLYSFLIPAPAPSALITVAEGVVTGMVGVGLGIDQEHNRFVRHLFDRRRRPTRVHWAVAAIGDYDA